MAIAGSSSATGSRALAIIAGLAVILAAAMLAVVLAWWGWRWLGPAAVDFVPAGPQDPTSALMASGLFAGTSLGTPTATETPTRTTSGDMHLLGVLAEAGGKGFALFRLPIGPRFVAAGQAVTDDVTLVSVQRDGVTVRDAGGERRLMLRPAGMSPAPKAAAKGVAVNAACLMPPGFKGDILRLNAELVGDIVAQPDTWAALAASDRGALMVRDDSGFTTMLAMKKGDRIEQANGIALRAPEDIVTAVLRPLIAGQAVRLIGSRGGAPREWLLQNAGTCP